MRTRVRLVLAAAITAAFLIPTLIAGATPGPATRPTAVHVAAVTPSTPVFCHDGGCHPLDPAGYVTDGTVQPDDLHCIGDLTQRLGCMAARRHQSIAQMLAPYQPVIVHVAAVAPASAAPAVGSAGHGAHRGYPDARTCVADTENGGSYGRSSNPSHFGKYQFSRSTWAEYGGNPATWGSASPAEQDAVFERAWRSPGGPSNWLPYDGC